MVEYYYTKVIERISNGKGHNDSLKVGVFRIECCLDDGSGEQVGEYRRDYHDMLDTFFPFQKDGNWYALYSVNHTCTRVMSLPDCEDIGGEEVSSLGFCPVDYYVPEYDKYDNAPKGVVYRDFGFVAGCVWGDDNSWKIQYLDLSKADKGIIERKDIFGYAEMPNNTKRLKDCVEVDGEFDESPEIRVTSMKLYWLDNALEDWEKEKK